MALTMKKAGAAPDGVRAANAPKTTRGRMPSKTSINFATLGVKHTRWWAALLAVVLIAAAAAAVANGRCLAGTDIRVQVPGGNLWVRVDEDTVHLTGKVMQVYEAETEY